MANMQSFLIINCLLQVKVMSLNREISNQDFEFSASPRICELAQT